MSTAHTPGKQCVECEGFCLVPIPAAVSVNPKACDILICALTGYVPEQLNDRDAEVVRKRGQAQWDRLIAIAKATGQQGGDK